PRREGHPARGRALILRRLWVSLMDCVFSSLTAIGGVSIVGCREKHHPPRRSAMKTLLLTLALIALPGLAFAQGDATDTRSFNNPSNDVVFFRAEVCPSTAGNCGSLAGTPAAVISSPNFVRGLMSFRVPVTQAYTIFFLAPDIEGALNPTSIVSQATGMLTAGDTATFSSNFSALGSGVYRFTAIVIGANGRATISQPYQFRYCTGACITD